MDNHLRLSPASQARLMRLARQTGLTPDLVIESLIHAADTQLVRVAARMTPAAVGHIVTARRWRPARVAT